ncbi:TPA: antitoxin [Citrobacter freundii]|nr:antitoxin [Citrobacter freundii]
MMQKFIIIQQHAWSNDHGYGIGYSSDLEKFDSREKAISHGFEVAGCDDFNIGVIDDERLMSLDWMEKPVGNGKVVSVEKLQIISDAIGLEAS